MLSTQLKQSDCGTFIDQMLNENMIQFRYSDKVFSDTITWLQAKNTKGNYFYSNEFVLVYISSATFVRDFGTGYLTTRMQ